MDYDKLCSEIFMIDPKIRFASVYDYWAERIAGGMRDGLESNLPEKITVNSVNQALLRWKSRKTTEEWIGKTNHSTDPNVFTWLEKHTNNEGGWYRVSVGTSY